MKFYADLHIHSRYSRATSRQMDLEHVYVQAQRKGITVVGTGDATHGAWLEELSEKLVEAEPGLYKLRDDIERSLDGDVPAGCRGPVRFVLSAEISNIYSADGQVRKVHNLCLMPDLERARRFRERLLTIGNLDSDGRPILGLDAHDLLEILLELEGGAALIPAHIWTPWYSALGSKSGFDTIEDCYRDLTRYIYAVETGLSSDPEMNWTCSFLDPFVLVSNSDAHSPEKLGREANLFDTELSYFAMRDAMMSARSDEFLGTVEFYPEEGKYHLDGHRKCGVVLDPAETVKQNGVCPVCKKLLTVGVANRVFELSDREIGERAPKALPFVRQVPLREVLGQRLQVGATSNRVTQALARTLAKLGPELSILSELPIEEIRRFDPAMAEGISRMRTGEVQVRAGYDGEYGVIDLFEASEIPGLSGQTSLLVPRRRKRASRRRAVVPEPATTKAIARDALAVGQVGLGIAGVAASDEALLDKAQDRVVQASGSPLLVHAGPGAGKTHVLVERIAHLVLERGVKANQIQVVTFTHRAAESLREGVERTLRSRRRGRIPRIPVDTFHSFCLRLLAEEDGLVPQTLDEDEAQVLLRDVLRRRDVARARRVISLLKQELAAGSASLPAYGIPGGQEQRVLFESYQAALGARKLLDLDDLISQAVAHLQVPGTRNKWQRRCRHLLVDEFQDVNRAQYELVRLLCPATKTGAPVNARADAVAPEVVAIGDLDQAIYRFRGADPSFFARFQRDFAGCKRLRLSTNYRSSTEIVSAAELVMSDEGVKRPKVAAAAGLCGLPVVVKRCLSEKAEAEFVAHTVEQLIGGVAHFSMDSERASGDPLDAVRGFGDFAVLTRTHAQAAPVAEALSRLGVPVRRSGAVRAWRSSAPVRQFLSFVRIGLGDGRPFDYRMIVPPLGLPGGAVEDLPKMDRRRFLAAIQEGAPDRLSPILLRSPEEIAAEGAMSLVEAFLRLMEYGPRSPGRDADDPIRLLLAMTRGKDWRGADVASRIRSLDDGDLVGREGERVHVLSLHASKGLEFPVVFLLGCDEDSLPYRRPGQAEEDVDLEEERRLLYVGMTRAARALYLVGSEQRTSQGKTVEARPSRFLAPLQTEAPAPAPPASGLGAPETAEATDAADLEAESLVTPEAAPAEVDEAPAKAEEPPTKADVAPAETKKAPAKAEAAPAETKKAPAKAEAAPPKAKKVAVSPEKTAAKAEEAPAKPKKAAAKPKKAPAMPLIEQRPADEGAPKREKQLTLF